GSPLPISPPVRTCHVLPPSVEFSNVANSPTAHRLFESEKATSKNPISRNLCKFQFAPPSLVHSSTPCSPPAHALCASATVTLSKAVFNPGGPACSVHVAPLSSLRKTIPASPTNQPRDPSAVKATL